MRRWFLLALAAALATAAVVAAAAVAGGTDGATAGADRGVRTLRGAAVPQTQHADTGAAWRVCGDDAFRAGPAVGGLRDPEARAEAEALRERHEAEMRQWWRRYGDDPHGDEARRAMRTLTERHREELRALLEEHGVELPYGLRVGDHARGLFGASDDGSRGHGRRAGADSAGASSWGL